MADEDGNPPDHGVTSSPHGRGEHIAPGPDDRHASQPDNTAGPGAEPDNTADPGAEPTSTAHPGADPADAGDPEAEPADEQAGPEQDAAPAPFSPVPPTWADPGRDYRPHGLPLEHEGWTREVETGVLTGARWVDRMQARIGPVAFAYATFKKYADDEGSRLAALMAYYTFLSIFPLMIGGVAILSEVLSNRPDLFIDIVNDVLPAAYEDQILAAYDNLPSGGTALAIALVGLLLAGTGGAFALYATVNQVFAVPYRHRYGFGPRYARIILVILLLAIAVLVVSVGGGFVGTYFELAVANQIAVLVLTVTVLAAALYASIKLLCRRPLQPRELLLGAILASSVITVIVTLGARLVAVFVSNTTPVYGAFATVVGVLSVLLLATNGLVISLEISVVRAWQLWPRGVDIHLLFPGDLRSYALLTIMDERMPSQRNDARFDADGHFDPRRPSLETMNHRQPGVPRTPYDPPSPNSSTS